MRDIHKSKIEEKLIYKIWIKKWKYLMKNKKPRFRNMTIIDKKLWNKTKLKGTKECTCLNNNHNKVLLIVKLKYKD